MIDTANQDMAFLLVALCSATAGALCVYAVLAAHVRKSRETATRLGSMANWWRRECLELQRRLDAVRTQKPPAAEPRNDADWWKR